VKKKILLPCAAATALLLGILIGITILETVPSDSFVILGLRETEIAPLDSGGGELGKIDINAASAVELTDLPGIGPALARRIIDYREEHGPFASVDDLLHISGIGERILERLKPYARCGE
jgi:competence protein ComEA